MENVITIVNTRANPLDFDIAIQGVDSKDAQVKFVIETNPVHFGFPCTRGEGEKWHVELPPLPQIEQISYNFHIEIVVDGYFFEPYRGTLNVTAEPEVKASEVSKARPSVTVTGGSGVSDTPEPVEEEKKDKPVDLDALAEKIISKKKNKPKKVVKEPTVEENEKDKIVRAAIAKFAAEPVKLPHKEEVIEEGGAEKAYQMGFDDGKNERPKKDAEKSFGPFAEQYYKGYEKGREVVDHEAWQEKTAAKRQGADYHESAEPRKSNLAGAIQKLEDGPELSDQAKRVRDIIGDK